MKGKIFALGIATLIGGAVGLNVTGAGHAPAAPQLQPTPIPRAYTAPVQTQSISNLSDATVTRCDATGGHCARLHVVVQADVSSSPQRIRSFASITCTSASGDFACAALQGSTWLNCTAPGGSDCSTDGPIVSCGSKYGKPACPSVLSTVTPWYSVPLQSQQYSGAATFVFTTGAAGGGSPGIGTATATFGF